MLASFWTSFWAWLLYILLFLLLLMGTVAVLARFKGGRYLRPVLVFITKVPILKSWLTKASEAAIRKQNPELASAMQKMQRSGAMNDPLKAQAAMSRLTAGERRAWMDAAMQQQEQIEEATGPMNREQRRRLEKAKRDAQRRGGKP